MQPNVYKEIPHVELSLPRIRTVPANHVGNREAVNNSPLKERRTVITITLDLPTQLPTWKKPTLQIIGGIILVGICNGLIGT
jgi:hypothetical protein